MHSDAGSGDSSISSRQSDSGSRDSGASNFARDLNTPGQNNFDTPSTKNDVPQDFASNNQFQFYDSQNSSPESAQSNKNNGYGYQDAAAESKNVPDDHMYQTADNDTTVSNSRVQAQDGDAAYKDAQTQAPNVSDDHMYQTANNDTTVANAQTQAQPNDVQSQAQFNGDTPQLANYTASDAANDAQNIPDDHMYQTANNDTTVANTQTQAQPGDVQSQAQFNGDTPQLANYTASDAANEAKNIPDDGMYQTAANDGKAQATMDPGEQAQAEAGKYSQDATVDNADVAEKAQGQVPGDNQLLADMWKEGQEQAKFATKDNADIKEPQEFSDTASQPVKDSRERVLDDYKKSQPDQAMQEKFETNMKDFEQRAQSEGLSQREVASTYDNVDKLLNTPSQYVTDEQRGVLAANVMDHAAHPDQIAQGGYDTCGATSVETDMFKNDPAAASDMVTQAATTGKWTDDNGRTVDVSKTGALEPRPESRDAYPQENERSFATQIMNNVIMNDMNQKGEVPKTYVQLGSDAKLEEGDNGERLLDRNGNRVTTDFGAKDPGNGPGATDEALATEKSKLGNDGGLMVYDPNHEAGKRVNGFGSQEEMEAKLQAAQQDGTTVTLGVGANEGQDGKLTDHYVTVDKYDADNKRAYLIDSADLHNNGWYSTSDMYKGAKRR